MRWLNADLQTGVFPLVSSAKDEKVEGSIDFGIAHGFCHSVVSLRKKKLARTGATVIEKITSVRFGTLFVSFIGKNVQ